MNLMIVHMGRGVCRKETDKPIMVSDIERHHTKNTQQLPTQMANRKLAPKSHLILIDGGGGCLTFLVM